MENRISNTRILVEGALMTALAVLLSFIAIFQLPMGGEITLCSMAPLAVMSYRHGVKWGMVTGLATGLLRMILNLGTVLYCTGLPAIAGCILLDYLVAFAVMGTAVFFGHFFKKQALQVAVGTIIACFLRFICSFLSGILIWGGYAPEGTPVWIYSFTYNGSYMLPETIITVLAVLAVMKALKFTEK